MNELFYVPVNKIKLQTLLIYGCKNYIKQHYTDSKIIEEIKKDSIIKYICDLKYYKHNTIFLTVLLTDTKHTYVKVKYVRTLINAPSILTHTITFLFSYIGFERPYRLPNDYRIKWLVNLSSEDKEKQKYILNHIMFNDSIKDYDINEAIDMLADWYDSSHEPLHISRYKNDTSIQTLTSILTKESRNIVLNNLSKLSIQYMSSYEMLQNDKPLLEEFSSLVNFTEYPKI